MRVLVCDDERQSARALTVVLRRAGFDVEHTRRAQAALDRAALRPPDAVIVERALPDGDGAEVCRRLREWSSMALIVVSAVDDEDETVRALEAGADDYVTKPFAARELVARLAAILRRARRGENDTPSIDVDGLEIDLAARVVRRDGAEVHLTPIEFGLLRKLLAGRGRVLTNGTLLRDVWGPAHVQDTAVLRTHIANLRRKIERGDGVRLIRTQHGVGYRFAEPASQPEPIRHLRAA